MDLPIQKSSEAHCQTSVDWHTCTEQKLIAELYKISKMY